jgi:PilZ domain
VTESKLQTEPGQNELNRRQFERLPVSIPVFVRGTDERGKDFLEFATALNISAGGALLASRRYIPPMAKISLEIPCAPVPSVSALPESVQRLNALLVRVMPSERFHLLGLRFSKPLIS